MPLLDFLVIYFACGAPFAVQRLVSSEHGSLVLDGISAASQLLVWPAVLFLKLSRVINFGFVSRYSSTKIKQVDVLNDDSIFKRRELAILLSRCTARNLGEIRELLERYSGLVALCCHSSEIARTVPSELVRISKHPAAAAAAACLNRRNLEIINRHRNAARNEFIGLMSSALLNLRDPQPVKAAVIEFATVFDPEALDTISLMLNSLTKSKVTSVFSDMDRTRSGLSTVAEDVSLERDTSFS